MRKWILSGVVLLLLGSVGTAQNGKVNPNGYNRFYFDNGVMSSEGPMQGGKPEGYWKNYYESGILKSEGNRVGHALDSLWKFYNEDGVLQEEISYKQGSRNGLTRKYSKEGFLLIEIPFIDDQKEGVAVEYYSNGAVRKEIPFVHGQEDGKVYEFDERGEIITITVYKQGIFVRQEKINRKNAEGMREGIWKTFYDDRTIKSEGKYNNGKPDGYWKEYSGKGELLQTKKFEQGKEVTDAEELANLRMDERFYPDSDGKIKFRGTFRDELAHGTHIWYALNGDIDSAKVFKNGTLVAAGDLTTDGLRVGEWREYYYPEGNVRAFGKYKEGFKVDYWEYYFQNGALEQKGKYGDKGLPTGEWTWYYESGAVQLTESFRAGKEHGIHIEYNDTGKVVSKGEFVNGLEEGEWFYEFGDHYEEGLYEEGMRQGIWKHYYLSNGRLRFEGSYFDDLPMNKHTWYYDTGVKMLEGSYVSGVQEGEWKRFNEDGSLFVTIEYNSGQEVKVDGLKLKVKGLDDQPSGE